MSRAIEDRNRRMLRARDTMDRAFAESLDVPALARSPSRLAHFSRQFRATFSEAPHHVTCSAVGVERAMELLRETDCPRDRDLL